MGLINLKKVWIATSLTLLAMTATACFYTTPAQAEVTSITIAHQNGFAYLPIYAMKELKLVEKHAKALGFDVTANYVNLGTPGIVRDAMIAGQVQFGGLSPSTLAEMTDKTLNNTSIGTFRAVGNIVSLPMFLNTTENVKSVCELKGKIAVATVKVAITAVTLQIATDKYCGNPTLLDPLTVGMTLPDGVTAILSGQIPNHFATPPFQYVELREGKGKVKMLLNSYDVLGGMTSFIVLAGSDKFAKDNPKVYKAVFLALEEALKWINEDKKRAAELYMKAEKTKETLENLVTELSSPDVLFDITPRHIETYARFMHKIGSLKHELDWKTLTMPKLHHMNGS